jgi:hypothetical protein
VRIARCSVVIRAVWLPNKIGQTVPVSSFSSEMNEIETGLNWEVGRKEESQKEVTKGR